MNERTDGVDRSGAEPREQASNGHIYPAYSDYRCPRCGHTGNDADRFIHHTNVGIICLKCGAKICD